ncbi:MAG: ABC transporter substrate-binding protein [Chloroflexi bacterium]|nr:ABC transporter substrate-binding protein [Chloroflexota bacterium]
MLDRSLPSRLLLIVFVLSILVLSACAPSSPAPSTSSSSAPAVSSAAASSVASKSSGPKTLTIAQTADPGTADPQLTTEEYFLPLNVFDRLVEAVTTAPGKSELVPGLAEKWDVSADGLTYTFYLRKNVKFHDGSTFTADDVIYTFDRMLNPTTKALNTDFLDMIGGASARLDGKAPTVSGLKKVDDNTVAITLGAPYAPFLANIATPAGSIFPKAYTEKAGKDFGTKPVGTGPFKVDAWTYNSDIQLSAYDGYFRGKAKFDKLIFRIVPDAQTQSLMFKKGELDVLDLDNARSQIPDFMKDPQWKNQIVKGTRVGTYYMSINSTLPPFDKPQVRQALQIAIDRQTLIDKLYAGTGIPAKGILSPGLAGYNPDLPGFAYDPEKAKALLKEAGFADGIAMTIFQTVDSPSTLKINEAIQAMLLKANIKAEIKQLDSAAYSATRKDGKLGNYVSDWSADFNDPDNFIYTFFAPKNSVARSWNYTNKTVQDNLEKARAMTDMQARYKLYQDIENTIVYKDSAFVPLFHLDHLFVVQPKVKNFKVSWNGWSNMPYYGIEVQ